MRNTPLVEFLVTWTAGNKAVLRDQGIVISVVVPHDPSSVAVAVVFAECQRAAVRTDGRHSSTNVMGQLALASDGLCLVELFDADTGETLYKDATTTADEAQLGACLTSFLDRMPS